MKEEMFGEKMPKSTIEISDNPRNENAARIIGDITHGIEGKRYKVIEDRREAIFESIRTANRDDVVLVVGKGHEDYQILGERVLHLSDREVVEECLNVAT